MKQIANIIVISLFIAACSENEQNEIVDRQVDRQIKRIQAEDAKRNAAIDARQKAARRPATSSFKRIDPYAEMREEGTVSPLTGSKAEQIEKAETTQ